MYDYSLLIEDVRKALSKSEQRIVTREEAQEIYNQFLSTLFTDGDTPQPDKNGHLPSADVEETVIFHSETA